MEQVSQVFSRAGRMSEPNMDPAYLGTLVMVGMNKKNYSPPLNAIKELYYSSTANSVNLAACLRTSSFVAAGRGSCRRPMSMTVRRGVETSKASWVFYERQRARLLQERGTGTHT